MSEAHTAHLRSFRQVVTSKRDALDGLIAEIDQALARYDGQSIRPNQQGNRGSEGS